ncbi:hypothetical protein MNBD_GAMMA21-2802 [hydrothermal vent metagenome]|uniref:Transmembrane protein n=1 Tax=hydrothermal vent metagenome TaxID=652676 RepID=A0A3B0ZRI1_9ZZZZ
MCLILLAVLMLVEPHRVRANDVTVTADETKLRAAIVLGILRFSSWPNDVRMASAFNLCTLGNPTSESTLVKISGQREYKDKPISTIVLNANAPDISKCNAIVIGPHIKKTVLSRFLGSKSAFGILTICDNCKPDLTSVMVYMLRKKNRVGFEVDLIQAKKNGMTFSSSLLELAIEVRQD